MAYHIHHTEGIILGSVNTGESNRFLYIFTGELGRVGAVAQAVRGLPSKLRYSLQDYSLVRADMIRGRTSWRITSAQPLHLPGDTARSKEKQRATVRTCTLLRRLCPEEQEAELLWREILDGLIFLHKEDLTPEEIRRFEIMMAITILTRLGYWDATDEWVSNIHGRTWSKKLLDDIIQIQSKIAQEISAALADSHL